MENNDPLRKWLEHPATPYLFGCIGWLIAWQLQGLLNYVLPSIEFQLGVALIFLPAGIRTLSVLIFGIRGAFGVFFGAMISTFQYMGTLPNYNLAFNLVTSAISALVAWIAMVAVCRLHHIDDDLSQLQFSDLLAIVISQGVVSASLHQILFHQTEISTNYGPGHDDDMVINWAAMAAGDITGSMILLLSAISIVKLLSKTTFNKG